MGLGFSGGCDSELCAGVEDEGGGDGVVMLLLGLGWAFEGFEFEGVVLFCSVMVSGDVLAEGMLFVAGAVMLLLDEVSSSSAQGSSVSSLTSSRTESRYR